MLGHIFTKLVWDYYMGGYRQLIYFWIRSVRGGGLRSPCLLQHFPSVTQTGVTHHSLNCPTSFIMIQAMSNN